MNAVEIEESLSLLASTEFDPVEFPFAFLTAFGAKDATLKRLRRGDTNASDVPGGLLWHKNIHLAVCERGSVSETLTALRDSPKTSQAKAKFILATDGEWVEAEDLSGDELLACSFSKLPDHFGFFLVLAGITTVKELKNSRVDIQATGRLNKLYVELLANNDDWARSERRHDMNHFMARLVFCCFAEDTDIFKGDSLFTRTLDTRTRSDGTDVQDVLETMFRALNTPRDQRSSEGLPAWTERFPYVNGGLFSGSTAVPAFTRAARSYLIRAGGLDWKEINPDIFGSMIQAVADDEERGALGMHYTSVPNILKVLNPLFLNDLRAQLDAAGDNKGKLLNLRKRMSRIRVFDPACGSGNFLVIAYKKMREIEAIINERRQESQRRTDIPLTNFRGIEVRDFPAEIARLALVIAEFQCDVIYRGQQEALDDMLPLDSQNWITCGNALRIDWFNICPPEGTRVKRFAADLFNSPAAHVDIDFENDGGETYICGNPPYLGSRWRDESQQSDLAHVFANRSKSFKDLDYVAAWYLKAADYMADVEGARCAFVATKSICQGEQVAMLWPLIFGLGLEISFAYRPFDWSNLASKNAGVTVVVVGLAHLGYKQKELFDESERRVVENIGPYLTATANIVVQKASRPMNGLARMDYGNKPTDGGHLILNREERDGLLEAFPEAITFVRAYVGSSEFISGVPRFCLWIDHDRAEDAMAISPINGRIEEVKKIRLASRGQQANANANTPYRFVFAPHRDGLALIVPRVSSERRPYLPAGFVDASTVVSDRAAVIYDPELWLLSIVASRLHLVWIATVCVRMRMDFSYSNTLGWHTFPVPVLTEQNKVDLTRCAEEILLARESHFPASVADLYDPDAMPSNLRRAHERCDEVLERIYIGRLFRNDTERLETLFELYTQMIGSQSTLGKGKKNK